MSHVTLDVWGLIFERCSPLGMARLAATCQRFYKKFLNHPEIAKWKCMKPNEGMNEAAESGYRDLVDLFISKGAKNWHWGLERAAYGGHRDLVDFFISKGANDWNWALYRATYGGHRDLVDLFISKGADDWNTALWGAAYGGHRDLAMFLEEKIKNVV